MSIYGLTMHAHSDTDPLTACYYNITEHPHYHDCENCRHAKYRTCEYGVAKLDAAKSRELQAKAREICRSSRLLNPVRLPLP